MTTVPALTALRLGYKDPLTDTFGAHPLLGAVLDLNDGQTFTLAAPDGFTLSAPRRTLVPVGNIRTQGEAVSRGVYQHNRTALVAALPIVAQALSQGRANFGDVARTALAAAAVAVLLALVKYARAFGDPPMEGGVADSGAAEPGQSDLAGDGASL